MSKKHLEWKVGLFVIIGLTMFAALVLKFSKGASAFVGTYGLTLKAENVGGIIPGATVLMAGVPIGNVVATDLDDDGKHVSIRLKLLKRVKIHGDAIFSINQNGFLGDRFVAVSPTTNKAPILQEGDTRICEEPFDLQEVARSASSLVKRVDQTVQQLSAAVTRIDRTLLAEQTLTNLTATVANFRLLSEQTLSTVDNLDRFVKANTPILSGSVSNFTVFTEELNKVALELKQTVITNRQEFTAAVRNLEESTAKVNSLLGDVQQGKGLAGNLLKNDELSANVSVVVSNLAVLSSNINNNGIWATLKKPKQPKATSSTTSSPARH